MHSKTAAKTIIIGVLAVVAMALWWYFTHQSAGVAEAVAVDRTALMRSHSPSMGRADASVVIVEFFDPACETCSTFYPMVKQLMAKHPDRIRLVMRYAPFHKGSDKVVAVLEATRRQRQF